MTRLAVVGRRIVLLCCLALLVGTVFPASAAPSPLIPVEAFWQKVSDTLAWLDTTRSPSDWQAMANSWAEIKQVELPGGQILPVDTSTIVEQLNAKQPDRQKLKSYLTALQKAPAGWPPMNCGDCGAGKLKEILARPEFQPELEQANPIQQFLQRIIDTITNWLDKLFSISDGVITIPSGLPTAVISLALAAILFFVFRDVFRNLVSEVELAEEISGENEVLTARLASQKAMQLSSNGDYRHAMRYLYLSALLLLDERGLLRYNRTLTNREYLRQVDRQPELHDDLKVVIDDFDRVWYGFEAVDQTDYERYAANVDSLEENKD
jgi:hypothetical protein